MFTPRDRRGCDQSFPPPIIIKLRAKIVDRNAYARGQNSSGIHRIYPFFLFYSVHPLYDHRASRKPRETRRLALVYLILFSQELENATSACSLQIARQLTDHSRVFTLITHTKKVFVRSFNYSFFFSKKWGISFRPLFFYICLKSDAANRNEANLRIVRMSYVMQDNKSLCRNDRTCNLG